MNLTERNPAWTELNWTELDKHYLIELNFIRPPFRPYTYTLWKFRCTLTPAWVGLQVAAGWLRPVRRQGGRQQQARAGRAGGEVGGASLVPRDQAVCPTLAQAQEVVLIPLRQHKCQQLSCCQFNYIKQQSILWWSFINNNDLCSLLVALHYCQPQ